MTFGFTELFSLLQMLAGHDSEVSHVAWNEVCSMWVSGSDDCTLRTWAVNKHDYLDVDISVSDTQVGKFGF